MEPPQRLTRPKQDKVIAGVCSGLGHYFDIDPVIVRIAWIVFTLAAGAGILAYLLAWFFIPDRSGQRSLTPLWVGLLLVVVPTVLFVLFMLPVSML
jgi:phage shock protein PspC (stress-responsive transcriptional regulator)